MAGSKSKAFTANKDAVACLRLAQSKAMLKGTRTNHIVIDETAVHLSGTVIMHAQKVKYASLFALQKPLKSIVPSCIGTPVPMTEIEMPTQFLGHIAAGAVEMMALMGLMTAAAAGGSAL